MSLDTKYRPVRYADVMGQGATTDVLRQFVRTKTGFNQSYLFCGQHGSGKTTLGRILARALLCENPQDGEPCDRCISCESILERGSSECFVEMDAASKSGKEHIAKIVEELEYSTVSGKRRIYLFDEAHRLSKQALDGLLKPMEDTVLGGEEKQLICIFCTTEPEGMRSTVFSRCAPAFTIRVVPPETIADRLAQVCTQEKIEHERLALVTIAEVTECHIRDALKMIEGVSMLGSVNLPNLNRYLRLDTNEALIKMIAFIGTDLGRSMAVADEVCQIISPSAIYERLTALCMMAFKAQLGVGKIPAYWKPQFIAKLGTHHGDFLVLFANCFASRPGRATASMLALDLAHLHQVRTGMVVGVAPAAPTPATDAPPMEVSANGTPTAPAGTSTPPVGNLEDDDSVESEAPQRAYETETGVNVDPRGINRKRRSPGEATPTSNPENPALDADAFRQGLAARVLELRSDGGRRSSG